MHYNYLIEDFVADWDGREPFCDILDLTLKE
jgi:hypothetical protein